MRDTVQFHVSADLPIRARALPFASRVELRFGKAFPVAFLVDREALPHLIEALNTAAVELDESNTKREEG